LLQPDEPERALAGKPAVRAWARSPDTDRRPPPVHRDGRPLHPVGGSRPGRRCVPTAYGAAMASRPPVTLARSGPAFPLTPHPRAAGEAGPRPIGPVWRTPGKHHGRGRGTEAPVPWRPAGGSARGGRRRSAAPLP